MSTAGLYCAAAGAAADVYIVCNLSCIDLPSLEEYVQQVSEQEGAAGTCARSGREAFYGWLFVSILVAPGSPERPRDTCLAVGFAAQTCSCYLSGQALMPQQHTSYQHPQSVHRPSCTSRVAAAIYVSSCADRLPRASLL